MPPTWRSGATPADLLKVKKLDQQIERATAGRRAAIKKRRAIIQMCYQRAFRAKSAH